MLILIWLWLTIACCSFAYIEFAEKDSAATAVSLDDTLFRGRQIKVCLSVASDENLYCSMP